MKHNEPLIKVDLLKSIIIHGLLLVVVIGGGYIQNRKIFLDLKSINNSSTNSIKTTENNIIPIKANLIDHKELQQAVKRQEKAFTDRIAKEKRLEQQEQKIAKLANLTEQEAKKAKQDRDALKQDRDILKKDKEALKKEQENLQKTVNKIKQQQQELAAEQAKLEQLKQENLKKKHLAQQSNKTNLTNQTKLAKNAGGTSEVLQTEIQNYYSKMREKIISNRKVTSFFPEHLECIVKVKILSNGQLGLVKLEKSSGNAAYDAFSEQAIYKSAPFDMPEDPKINKELVEQELEFGFSANLVSNNI